MVPAHLNEVSPEDMRGTFPGFAYQLGKIAMHHNAIHREWQQGLRRGRVQQNSGDSLQGTVEDCRMQRHLG